MNRTATQPAGDVAQFLGLSASPRRDGSPGIEAPMEYVGTVYRPPSEADALILQATLGCSWNNCTYCGMYRDKHFSVRPMADRLAELATAGRRYGSRVAKLFVADGDAIVLPTDDWLVMLAAARKHLPGLGRTSCYATADGILHKGADDLARLREAGLSRVYIGPESGDEITLRRIAKGPRPPGVSRDVSYLFDAHAEASRMARAAGIEVSAIFLLGAGGVARSLEHARGSARLATAMDPAFLSALTLTVVPGTPLDRTAANRGFVLPDPAGLLGELRVLIDEARPTDAMFRTNHASNYLPLGGQLPRDRHRLVAVIDAALDGRVPLRAEASRGL